MAAVFRAILTTMLTKTNFRYGASRSFTISRLSIQQIKDRYFSTHKSKPTDEELNFDKPIKYSTSPAATWKAESSFSGSPNPDITPWYQPHVVCLSVAIFLIYFCILREENDIDHKLEVPLFDHVEGLEEVQLKNVIQYYKTTDPSYNVEQLEKRLAEVQDLKNAKSQVQL